MSDKETLLTSLDAQQEQLTKMAQDIWSHPELALGEHYAVDLQVSALEQAGFELQTAVAEMPTAFVASWGQGSPVIGILGEYDALPGLSQEISSERKAIEEGSPGHGCGHNVFGTAGLGAAIAVKEALAKNNSSGTIRYYGCPAEETLVGKTFMARAGVFDDLDAAITWHPGSVNKVINNSSAAMNSFKVNFYGTASHAGGAPHLGRSALDGVQLMDVGVNYLREHVIQEARLHSVITSGGEAPNVVPAFAQAWWYVRAPTRQQVDEIYTRVLDIAEGAALMTGTSHEIDFVTACYDFLANSVLSDLMLANMRTLEGTMVFSKEEQQFAEQLQASFPPGSLEGGIAQLRASTSNAPDSLSALNAQVFAHVAKPPASTGSTEVGDVSYITPTVQMSSTCWPLGTPGHSWQTVAACGSSIGMKGMIFAAKAMALTAYDLLTQPELLARAQAEFKAADPYVTPLPEGVRTPVS